MYFSHFKEFNNFKRLVITWFIKFYLLSFEILKLQVGKAGNKHRLNTNKFHINFSHFPPRFDPVLVL